MWWCASWSGLPAKETVQARADPVSRPASWRRPGDRNACRSRHLRTEPTFRHAMTGIWAKFQPADLATPQTFARDPERVSRWHGQRVRRSVRWAPVPHPRWRNQNGQRGPRDAFCGTIRRRRHGASSGRQHHRRGSVGPRRWPSRSKITNLDFTCIPTTSSFGPRLHPGHAEAAMAGQ
jgi:hypothetical protein